MDNPPSAVTRALSIPEILNRVAYFIPAWHCTVTSTAFTPRALVWCSRVSKLWRAIMLPHIWSACNPSAMRHIPPTLLAANSVYFKYLDQESPYWNPRASHCTHVMNFPLYCTKLKSFSITTFFNQDQVRMLITNPHMTFLEIREYKSSRDRNHVERCLRPLARSLKELRIRDGRLDGRDLLRILRCLPHLESLGCFAKVKSTETSRTRDHVASLEQFQVNADKNQSVDFSNLKHITVSSGLLLADSRDILLTIFVHCPGLESIEVQSSSIVIPDSFLQVASRIRRRVMQWRDQVRAWRVLAATPATLSSSNLLISDGQGLRKLVIQVYDDHCRDKKRGYQVFDHHCENLVELEAGLRVKDAPLLNDGLFAYMHTLRRVEIECVEFGAVQQVDMIKQIINTFTELRVFMFASQVGFTKQESMAIFDREIGSSTSEPEGALVPTARPAKWSCDNLESLDLRGLWQGGNPLGIPLPYYHLSDRKGQGDKAELDEGLLEMIFLRVQELPKLQKLKLNNFLFSAAVFRGQVPRGL
ncbi:hypothetical protein BG003_006965 [Podila horticola]|nr:hypothetical protein BG003_006965 [Podila horticola]